MLPRASAGALIALALAVAGCGGSVSIGGGKTVSKAEIEKQAQAKFDGLAKTKGIQNFPKITCPGDLDAKTGASEKCSAKFPEGTLGITTTVTGTEGENAQLHFQADPGVNQ